MPAASRTEQPPVQPVRGHAVAPLVLDAGVPSAASTSPSRSCAGWSGDGSGDSGGQEWAALTRPYIRGRLDALAAELERLDRDPDVFAKAFHTMAARSALESLLADLSRLADRPARPAGPRFEVEAAGTSTGSLEALEL
jgi:hypothetical protein